jgi:hypothetical protein
MPTEIEHGHRPDLFAIPFGTDQPVREVGFAGSGAAGLGATDVPACHHGTAGRDGPQGGVRNIMALHECGEKQAPEREDGLRFCPLPSVGGAVFSSKASNYSVFGQLLRSILICIAFQTYPSRFAHSAMPFSLAHAAFL